MLSNPITTNISSADAVVLYPTFGHLTRHGRTWRVPITGSVFASGDPCRRKRRWVRLLQRLNRLHPTDEQRDLFEQRISQFVAATERGKRLAVRVGDQVFPIKRKTKRNGLLTGSLVLPVDSLPAGAETDGWLPLEVVRPDGDDAGFRGLVRLLPPTGISVMSDIDDTVKVTHVSCRRSLLEYTFLREFEAVQGMAEVYSGWAQAGAAFHYVSSSPWQLYAPLRRLFDQVRLPLGTFHLRSYRLHEHLLRRVWKRRAKLSVLKSIVRAFPFRQFVLVGDSGERDPEIYGALTRRYRSQVLGVYVREVPQRPMTAKRCAKAFRGLRADQWQVFSRPDDLPTALVT